MKILFWSVAIFLTGCSSYLDSSQKLETQITYHYLSPDKLLINATVTNKTKTSITLVDHPNFYTISIWARDRRLIEDKVIRFVDFYPPGVSALRKVPSGKSFTFSHTFGYRRVSPTSVEVTEGISSPFFRVRDSKLVAEFSYGFYPDYFPSLGHIFRSHILTSGLEANAVIPAK